MIRGLEQIIFQAYYRKYSKHWKRQPMGISILMEKMFILKKPYRISKMFLEKISVYFSSITVQGQTYSAYLPSPIPITPLYVPKPPISMWTNAERSRNNRAVNYWPSQLSTGNWQPVLSKTTCTVSENNITHNLKCFPDSMYRIRDGLYSCRIKRNLRLCPCPSDVCTHGRSTSFECRRLSGMWSPLTSPPGSVRCIEFRRY